LSIDWKALWHGAVVGEIVALIRGSALLPARKNAGACCRRAREKLREPVGAHKRLELINAQVHFREPKANQWTFFDQVH
jgi:hypothetical protein